MLLNLTRNCARRLSINRFATQTNSLLNKHAVICAPLAGKLLCPVPPTQTLFRGNSNKALESQQQLQCIYKGPLGNRMKMVKVFSLTTSLVGLAAQPLLMEAGNKVGGTGMAVFFCTCAGFFTFVTPVLLHFITKKYVTEIHYDKLKDEYTATTVSLLLRKIDTKFKTSDVKVPDVPGMFTSFLVGNKPLLVEYSFFTEPEHYARIMGYDKPMDLKLDITKALANKKKQ